MSSTGSRHVNLQKIGRATRADHRDLVAVEEPMEVRVNGAPFAVIMRTPGADRELAAGFLLAEDVDPRRATSWPPSNTARMPTKKAATTR